MFDFDLVRIYVYVIKKKFNFFLLLMKRNEEMRELNNK